jgi:hypothetical protein
MLCDTGCNSELIYHTINQQLIIIDFDNFLITFSIVLIYSPLIRVRNQILFTIDIYRFRKLE